MTARVGGPTKGGGGRLRWLVAGLATVLVVVLVGGALLLAAPRAGAPSAVAHYAPASSAAYMELRLDLPGDQHDKLAAFMGHFPGFADPSTFDQKLDEALSQALSSKDGNLDWSTDVAPWFGGEMAVFAGDLARSADGAPSMVAVMTVTDRAALDAVIADQVGTASVDTVDHNGIPINTVTTDSGDEMSYAVTDDALLVSPRSEDIAKALDVQAGDGSSLADDQFYLQQLGALPADRMATAYVDLGRAVDGLASETGSDLPDACLQAVSSAMDIKMVGSARAESDHLVFTGREQRQAGANLPPLPANSQSTLAQAMPPDTLAYVEMRDVGTGARWLLDLALGCMDTTSLDSAGSGLDISKLSQQFLGTDLQDYFDFVGDAAVGVSSSGDSFVAGMVASVDDSTVARERVDKLVSLLTAFGFTAGINVETVDHNGTEITVISLADPPADLPPFSLALTVAGDRLYVGAQDWVTAALDRQASDSLWSSDRFQKAITTGGNDNAGVVYLDLAGLMASPAMGSQHTDQADFETNVKPFLEPLDTLTVIRRVDGGIVVTNAFLFVE